MKKCLALFLFVLSFPILAQDNFVRGVFLFGSTSVDYVQMHDSLHINWVQAEGEDGTGYKFTNVLNNAAGLNVMGQMNQVIVPKSSAQRMLFDAWRDGSDPNYDYFAIWNGTRIDTLLWDLVGRESPGYMVESPVPDNEYRYKQTHYIVSFILKRTPASSGNPLVVRLEAWCKNTNTLLNSLDLYNNDFTSSNLETKTLEFTFSSPPTSAVKPDGVLLGSLMTSGITSGCLVNNEYKVDIRVYWYGNVTTWLNKVIVQDNLGQELFSGTDDATIQSSAQSFKSSYPLVKRFYLTDEPYISTFLAYNYVQNIVRSTYLPDTVKGNGSGITAQPTNFSRFILDAKPYELFVDSYPILSDVPTPSMTPLEASDVGIATYISDADYTQQLQNEVGSLTNTYSLINTLRLSAVTTAQNGRNFWFIPQLHGVYVVATGKFRLPDGSFIQRPPAGNEIKLMCNLAVAYGAKGIVPYPYGNDYDNVNNNYFAGLVTSEVINGMIKNHWTNYASYPCPGGSKQVRMGFQEKWDALASVMNYYTQISITLSSLSWQGTKSWDNGTTSGTWSGLISAIDASSGGVSDQTKYVETGHFKNGSTDFLYVVNRRTLSTDTRDISLTINESSSIFNNWKITEVGTSNTWTVSKTGTFTTSFQPGEGKLFKLEGPVILIGGSLVYNENIPASSNINISSNITVNSGVTLTFNYGTTLNFTSGVAVTANGTLNAQGTSTNPATFNNGFIIFSGSGASGSNLNYATINNGAGIQCLNGANATIQNSILNNCVNGIYVYNSSPQIFSNLINEPQQNGIYGETAGYEPNVQDNTVTKTSGNSSYHNYQGIWFYNNSSVYANHNDVSGFRYGSYIGGGSNALFYYASKGLYPYNRFTNNFYGITAGWGATITANWVVGDGGNSIYGNTYYDAYSYNSSTIYGQKNYWGGGYPKQYTYNNSYIYVDPILTSDPWVPGGIQPIAALNGDKKVQPTTIAAKVNQDQSTTGDDFADINLGLKLENDNQISQAISHYKSLIGSDRLVTFSLTELMKIRNKYPGNKIASYFQSLTKNKKHGALANKLVGDIYLQSGKFDEAINTYNSIIQNYPNDYQAVNSRFGKLFAYLNIKQDRVNAGNILTELKQMNLQDDEWQMRLAVAENLLTNSNSLNKTLRKAKTENQVSELKPVSYSLSQNYPNPFNPTTIINYQLPKDGIVTLKIYDMLGREVATLVNEFKPSGRYEVTFDAKNLASGMYVYQLRANSAEGRFIATKKLVLLK